VPPSTDRQRRRGAPAVPAVAPSPPAALTEEVLVVDGERFLLREHAASGRGHVYSYDWLTGPNPGYGFGSSGPSQSPDDHVTAIRGFLSEIDPDTGYLADD
jgi:hypothetical protein